VNLELQSELTPKQTAVILLALHGVYGIQKQAALLGLSREAVKNHHAAVCIRLDVPNIREAVQKVARGDDVILPSEEVEAEAAKRKEQIESEARQNIVNRWKALREAVLRFIADEWHYSRSKQYTRFEDIVRAFDNDIVELRHAVKQLERTDWIEIVNEDGVERYRPLARP